MSRHTQMNSKYLDQKGNGRKMSFGDFSIHLRMPTYIVWQYDKK